MSDLCNTVYNTAGKLIMRDGLLDPIISFDFLKENVEIFKELQEDALNFYENLSAEEKNMLRTFLFLDLNVKMFSYLNIFEGTETLQIFYSSHEELKNIVDVISEEYIFEWLLHGEDSMYIKFSKVLSEYPDLKKYLTDDEWMKPI